MLGLESGSGVIELSENAVVLLGGCLDPFDQILEQGPVLSGEGFGSGDRGSQLF